MASMTVRTTVAFDPATAARLERLAKRWGISKSETLRRVLEKAEQDDPVPPGAQPAPDFTRLTPVEILDWLRDHPSPPVPGGWGPDARSELRELREQDARIEAEREQQRAAGQVAAATHPQA
jgi:hypothetical protein